MIERGSPEIGELTRGRVGNWHSFLADSWRLLFLLQVTQGLHRLHEMFKVGMSEKIPETHYY